MAENLIFGIRPVAEAIEARQQIEKLYIRKGAEGPLMQELKAQGRSIIMISEELAELIGMSDRLLILKDGALAGEFFRSPDLTDSQIIDCMI